VRVFRSLSQSYFNANLSRKTRLNDVSLRLDPEFGNCAFDFSVSNKDAISRESFHLRAHGRAEVSDRNILEKATLAWICTPLSAACSRYSTSFPVQLARSVARYGSLYNLTNYRKRISRYQLSKFIVRCEELSRSSCSYQDSWKSDGRRRVARGRKSDREERVRMMFPLRACDT